MINQFIKGNGKMEKEMGEEKWYGEMEVCMRAFG